MSRTVMQRLFEPPSIREMAPGTKVIVYGILLFWTAFVLFPIYWVFITSFKTATDVNAGPVYLPFIDFQPSLHAWKELFVFDYKDTLRAYVNSLIIALSSTAAAVLIGFSLLYSFNAASMVIEIFWFGISCVGLYRSLRQRRSSKAGQKDGTSPE